MNVFVAIILLVIAYRLTRRVINAEKVTSLFRTCIGLKRHGPLCLDYPDVPGCDPAPWCPTQH